MITKGELEEPFFFKKKKKKKENNKNDLFELRLKCLNDLNYKIIY